VELQQWQDAVKECTEAIKIEPKNEYAHAERSLAYKALGDNEKANQDLKNAGRYNDDYSDRFMMDKVSPVIFIVISAYFLVIGFTVLLRKKPILLSSKWTFAIMILCFSPNIINILSIGGIQAFWGICYYAMATTINIRCFSYIYMASNERLHCFWYSRQIFQNGSNFGI